MISAVIITKNEEKNIERCLRSIEGIADEIVLVDSMSTDRTVEIAKQFNAQVIQKEFDGYIQDKNLGNQHASNQMILSLDADEALSPELRASILELKSKGLDGAYSMNRLNHYEGVAIKRGGWYPDRKIRLFNKNSAIWGGPTPHETVILKEGTEVIQLQGDLLHYTYDSKADHQARAKKYASLRAESLKDRSKLYLLVKLILSPPIRFIKSYIFKLGILDGKYGWRIASIDSWETAMRYRLAMQNHE